MQPADVKYLSISEVNRALNGALEEALPLIFFEGEISEIVRAGSGHIYFSLKDEQSQLSACMWNGVQRALTFKPDKGMHVRCEGRPSVYSKNGRLQIVVQRMVEAGEGLLQKKFLELKAKLEREGLFAMERKRRLPFLPTSIGVVTSASGAVIHDIMVRIRNRMPALKVFLMDVRVQGPGAAQEIAEGVKLLGASGLVQAIIVARGGGSLEDLWAFNEEVVVRAIFASPIPVISGVGHEVDVTLSDYVADVRAPTPTAAAEMVVPRREDLLEKVAQCEKLLYQYDRWFQSVVQSVDDLDTRLSKCMVKVLEGARLHLQACNAKLRLLEPSSIIAHLHSRLEVLSGRLGAVLPPDRLRRLHETVKFLDNKLEGVAMRNIEQKSHALKNLTARLVAVNPRAVLERGYSIVESKGKVVISSEQLQVGDDIEVSFRTGRVDAKVSEVDIASVEPSCKAAQQISE